METGFQFRNVFNQKSSTAFATRLKKAWPSFAETEFKTFINEKIDHLQYGERSNLITEALHRYLPKDFPQAVQILLDALGPELKEKDLSGIDNFIIVPQTRYVSKYGQGHYELSMRALYEMTKRFSAEGDLGYFIELEPEKTLQKLAIWARDPNCHVRRLVSEGTRPRLPLGRRLKIFIRDPGPVITLLELLKTDPELYVRRSVANNLNDISKDNPDIVIQTLQSWSTIKNPGTQWIIRHASRTLLKTGNKEALALLGYTINPEISVNGFKIKNAQIHLGNRLEFECKIKSKTESAQNLMIDYCIHFVKANGKTAPKVFKLAKKSLGPRETLYLSKKHLLAPMTTRKLYAGEHQLEIIVNGDSFGTLTFNLITN